MHATQYRSVKIWMMSVMQLCAQMVLCLPTVPMFKEILASCIELCVH